MQVGSARISAALVFADLRQVTNEIEEAHQYSNLADAIQRDRCLLLSSYESVSLAYTMARSTLRVLTWKSTGRQPTAEKCCARSGATREPALLISLKSNLPFFDLGHSRRGQNEKSHVSRSTLFHWLNTGWRRSDDRARLHANSVLTGNFTGNFAISRLREPISWLETTALQ